MKKKVVLTKFFDFYSIIELYLRTGGFRDNPNYRNYPVFVSWRSEEKIREAYEEIVNSFYDDIYNALIISIKSELINTRNYSWGFEKRNATEAELKYAKDHPKIDTWIKGKHKVLTINGITAVRKKLNLTFKQISLAKNNPHLYPDIVYFIFSKLKWSSWYGGKKWAKGVLLLKEASKIKSLEDKICWVDSVLDLYHNTGHLIDKTHFRYLSNKKYIKYNGRYRNWNMLDFRANARSIMDFLPYNSDRVKRLVIPKKNILTNNI